MVVVLSMQLIEAVLWKNQECNNVNDMASKIAIFQNLIQPYAMVAALWYVKNFEPNLTAKIAVVFYILLYTSLMFAYFYQNYPFCRKYCTKPDCSSGYCNMTWAWTEWNNWSCKWIWPVHVCWLFLPLLVLQNLAGLGFTLFAGFSLVAGAVATRRTRQRGSAASMWCLFSAFGPLLYLSTS